MDNNGEGQIWSAFIECWTNKKNAFPEQHSLVVVDLAAAGEKNIQSLIYCDYCDYWDYLDYFN